MRERIQGEPLSNAERKALVERCRRHRPKRQINLAKNGYYGSLVPIMVRDAFLTEELVRVDVKGLERSDYKKIGCKLRDLVPCILVTFEKEQIIIWRGKVYKPVQDGFLLADRELFDALQNDMVQEVDWSEERDDLQGAQDFDSGDE